MKVYNLSNGFLRHHFSFPVRTGIIFCEIVVFLCLFVFQEVEPAVISDTPTLGLQVALTSSIPMEKVERNLLKTSVTRLTRTVLEWQLSVTTVKTERWWMDFRTPAVIRAMSRSLWAVFNVGVLSLKALSQWLRLLGVTWWRGDEVLGMSGFYRLQMCMRLEPYMCKPLVRM